jgi:hypothetical protein
MTAKYVCSFAHPKTGERREVLVELDEHDEACVQYHLQTEGPDHADFIAEACALRRAYQEVRDEGFLHACEPKRVFLQ